MRIRGFDKARGSGLLVPAPVSLTATGQVTGGDGNERYSGPMPSRGSIGPYLEMAGSTSGIGNTVTVPHGVYTASRHETTTNRTGWLNLVAELGPGSVRIEGVQRLNNARKGIRFIGFDIQGQWYTNKASDVAWWYGHHHNENELSYAGTSNQPSVFQLTTGGLSTGFGVFGCQVSRSVQDLIKANNARELLIQGVLFVDTKWEWAERGYSSTNGYHSDGLQYTGGGSYKVLDSYFCEDSRLQLAQNFSYPLRGYWARSWTQGVPTNGGVCDPKGQPDGPYITYGPAVHFGARIPDSVWDGLTSAEKKSIWGHKGSGMSHKAGTVVTGSYSSAKPAGYDASVTKPARFATGSPEKVWAAANPFSTWQSFFASAASTWSGSDGGAF